MGISCGCTSPCSYVRLVSRRGVFVASHTSGVGIDKRYVFRLLGSDIHPLVYSLVLLTMSGVGEPNHLARLYDERAELEVHRLIAAALTFHRTSYISSVIISWYTILAAPCSCAYQVVKGRYTLLLPPLFRLIQRYPAPAGFLCAQKNTYLLCDITNAPCSKRVSGAGCVQALSDCSIV